MKKSFYLSGLLIMCFSLFSRTASAQAVITADPSNVTACDGSVATFGIHATGATSYIWQISADGGISWDTAHNGAFFTTATTDTIHVNVGGIFDGFLFRAIAIATAGKDTSASASLTVQAPGAGTVTGPDALCQGTFGTFTNSMPGGVWSNVFHTIDTITAAGIDTARTAGMDTIKYTVTNSCGTSETWKLLRVDAPAVPMPITGPTAVCVGNNIVLANANNVGTHSWSSDNTAIATVSGGGTVHGVGAGFANITYTYANTCGNTVTTSIMVHVETPIIAGTITGANTVCAGSLIHLVSSVGGGIWLSGTTAAAVVDGSGNVTGIAQGVSLISYYASNSCGASFATHSVEVVVPAATITGNDSVGIDSTLMLSNTTPGGVWSSSETSIATIGSTGLVTGVDTGAITINYSVTNACGTSSASMVLHVGPRPFGGVIYGADSVCIGSTITLGDTTNYGEIISWTSKWDTVATVTSAGVVTGVGYGVDTIYATVRSAFGTTIVKKGVAVNRPPVVTLNAPDAVVIGNSYMLVGTPAGGTFSVSNPSMTPFSSYGYIVVLTPGTSIISYSVTNTCGTTVAKDTVTLSLVGVNNIAGHSASLNVFPNPSNGSVTLNLAAAVNESVVVTITNLIGEKVKELTVNSNVNTEITLDQPSGVYVLSAVTKSGEKYTTKINIVK